jgi:Ca2+/Na+ antiporter
MDVIMMVAGLALLLGGGEGLVRGGVGLATRMRLPMAVVGAVVLGFGTSMPELLTSLSAAWAGAPGIAVGNVVGSNIANILLILGVAALITVVPGETATLEDRVWLIAATLLGLGLLSFSAVLGRLEGALLLAALGLFLWRSLSRETAAEALTGYREHGGLAHRGADLRWAWRIDGGRASAGHGGRPVSRAHWRDRDGDRPDGSRRRHVPARACDQRNRGPSG